MQKYVWCLMGEGVEVGPKANARRLVYQMRDPLPLLTDLSCVPADGAAINVKRLDPWETLFLDMVLFFSGLIMQKL